MAMIQHSHPLWLRRRAVSSRIWMRKNSEWIPLKFRLGELPHQLRNLCGAGNGETSAQSRGGERKSNSCPRVSYGESDQLSAAKDRSQLRNEASLWRVLNPETALLCLGCNLRGQSRNSIVWQRMKLVRQGRKPESAELSFYSVPQDENP